MLNSGPLKYYLRRLTGQNKQAALSSLAEQTIQIEPASTTSNRSALLLPNITDRISGYCIGTDKDFEYERLFAKTRNHTPTKAYKIKNAVLSDGNLFIQGNNFPQLPQRKHHLLLDLTLETSPSALTSSLYGMIWWGHWLLDDCSRYLLAEGLGTPVEPETTKFGHRHDYETLLGMNLSSKNNVLFTELWMFDDRAQNESKRRRYDMMRGRILDGIGCNDGRQQPGVYIWRGDAGERRVMSNERAVADRFKEHGFRVVDPCVNSVREILDACAGAQVVAGVEGSALAHGISVMAPESTLIVINPPSRFNSVYKDMADCKELYYAIMIGVKDGDDFKIPIDEIDLTLALIEKDKGNARPT